MIYARIIESSLRNAGLVIIAALILLVAGVAEYSALPVDVLPDVTRPLVTVQAEVPGLAPEDVESQVTVPLEAALSGLQGIARLRSVSAPGLSVINAEFGWSSDAYRNRQLAAERIDGIRSRLPPGTEARISPQTSLMGEVYLLALQMQEEGSSPAAVREHADWVLKPRLLALPGVAQVTVIGGEVRQYEVQPDAGRMRLHGVDLAQINQAIAGLGGSAVGGYAYAAGQEIPVRNGAQAFRIEDLQQAAVAWKGGGAVRLGQVAQVGAGAMPRRGDAGANGHAAVILAVQKAAGADTLRLTGAIESTLATAARDYPAGVQGVTLFRQADFISESIGNLRAALLHGAVIVGVLLLLFLRGARLPLVALTVIPLSLFVAILALRAFGLSINTMTLGGLAIAIGELVDDAVIGVENVARRLREPGSEHMPLMRVIADATLEMRAGVLHATLLIVLSLLPLFAVEGFEGRLFAPMALAYIAAVTASLLVALTLTPVLCRHALGGQSAPPEERGWLLHAKAWYAALLRRALARPAHLYGVVGALFAFTVVAAALIPRSFLPAFNERSLTVNVLLNPGISLEESARAGAAAETLALQVPEVTSTGRRTGRAEGDEHAEGVHYTELDLALRPSARSRAEIVEDLRARLSVLPAAITIGQPISHRIDHILSGVRAPLAVKVFGEDFETLEKIAAEVAVGLRGIAGIATAEPEKTAAVPQLRIRFDARRAAQYGASVARLQEFLGELLGGRVLSRIVEGRRSFDLVMRLPAAGASPENLGKLLLDTPAGPVPLSWLADAGMEPGQNQIARENSRRRIAVAAWFDERQPRPAAASIKARLAGIQLPAGYELRIEGEAVEASGAAWRIAGVALAALLLMLAVLYGRYGSWAITGMIMLNVPLSLAGGVIALLMAGLPFSVSSLIGFVTLGGIAARNGILIVSRYLDRSRTGLLNDEAIMLGAIERFTPMLLTAAITALALLPLLLGGDAPGKEILHPVAVVIFGGLIGSTALNGLLIPVLFRHQVRARSRQDA